MAELPTEIVSGINRVLAGMRLSLDSGYLAHSSRYPELDDIRKAYLQLEDIRFVFRSNTRLARSRRDLEPLEILRRDLLELEADERFMYVADRLRYRPGSPVRQPPLIKLFHPALNEGAISTADALHLLNQSIDMIQASLEGEPRAREFDFDEAIDPSDAARRIRQVVPTQQRVAPIQYAVSGNRLVVVSQPAAAGPEDRANIDSARADLVSRNRAILEQLEQSNCDRRLLDTFKDLDGRLSEEADIVRLGLSNIACEIMCEKFECELPDAVAAMMKAQNVSVGMYVAQFPEWRRFTEQAASAELSRNDVPQIASAVTVLLSEFSNKPEIADAEVPRSLKFMKDLLADPERASRRAIFAVWRSLENLVITIYNYGAEFLDKTVSKAIESGSTIAGKAIVVALMGAALSGAIAMTPVASGIPQSAWIARASEVVKGQIESLAVP